LIANQQPAGYGLSTGNPQAFVIVQPAPLADPPNDYLGYSIFVTICCCWMVGIFAIVRSCESRTASRIGNRPEAELRSRQAKNYSHIALVLGLVTMVLLAVIMGVVYGVVLPRLLYSTPRYTYGEIYGSDDDTYKYNNVDDIRI